MVNKGVVWGTQHFSWGTQQHGWKGKNVIHPLIYKQHSDSSVWVTVHFRNLPSLRSLLLLLLPPPLLLLSKSASSFPLRRPSSFPVEVSESSSFFGLHYCCLICVLCIVLSFFVPAMLPLCLLGFYFYWNTHTNWQFVWFFLNCFKSYGLAICMAFFKMF